MDADDRCFARTFLLCSRLDCALWGTKAQAQASGNKAEFGKV